ncbi:MAG: altronate dehydratase [Spirochaetales bacterium]|nr:altronate dehydratase [Spirochaetales bacterium]
MKAIRIRPEDSVAVAVRPLQKGERIVTGDLVTTVAEEIAGGHKVALKAIGKGEAIIKYGAPIGSATKDIAVGEHVHTHNASTRLSEHDEYRYDPSVRDAFQREADRRAKRREGAVPTIEVFERPDGRIGIRNEIWIVPTVGCVNMTAEHAAKWAEKHLPKNEHYEGTHAWTHPFGCSQLGDDHEATRTILADLVHHPNAGGVLVLSLGCENNTPESFRELLGEVNPRRVKFLTTQEVEDELEAAYTLIRELYDEMQSDVRTPVGMDRLIVGFKCGGSDGYSGITANPLVGYFCDELTAMGGTGILTEVPEMFGAERLLMNRAADEEVYGKIVSLIEAFKRYFIKHGRVVYENPSPGNKEGGITTLEDKSLGCIQKGGTAIVTDVIPYGGRVAKRGLTLLSGPGNDIVSTTALTAAGAHIILFTTGRGTPLGSPVPTVKIASNTALAEKKPHWIDFDAERLLREKQEVVVDDFIGMIKEIAGGKKPAKNEEHGYREISILKDGVVL